MLTKFPKDDQRFQWTRHIKNKMMFYGLSEGRIRRVIKSPLRREEGIAEGTIAVMQPSPTKKREEIWVMYKRLTNNKKLTTHSQTRTKILMISAWRYPGTTKPGEQIRIPEDALAELAKFL